MSEPALNLSPIQRPVRSARRRLLMQKLVARLPLGLSAGLGLGAGYLLCEPMLAESIASEARWWIVGGLAGAGTLIAGLTAFRRRPDFQTTALEVDARYELRERLTSALGLSEAERNTPAGRAVIADAAAKAAPIDVRKHFPIRPRATAGLVPVVAGLAALAFFFPITSARDLIAGGEAAKKADAVDETKAEVKNLTPFTQRNKPPELAARTDKSKELQDLEESINDLIKKHDTNPNREDPEKLREKVADLTALEQKVKAFNEEKRDRLEKLEKQLETLDRLNKDKDFEDGPAKNLNKALQQGDLPKAKEELDQLKKKIKENKLDEKEKEQLKNQIEKMREQLEKSDKNKEREEKLKDMVDKAKKEGREQDAESLERELKQLQKECAECKEAGKDLAESLKKAKQALDKGDAEEAAKELENAAKNLEKTEGDLKDLEESEQNLQRLKEEKGEACKKCKGDKNGEQQGDKDDADWNEFTSPATGRRKENKDAKTASEDQRIRGLFDPKGKKTYGGSTKGQAFKTASAGELGPAIQTAAQEAPAAADSQRLPRDAKQSVKEYFEQLGGQSPGGK